VTQIPESSTATWYFEDLHYRGIAEALGEAGHAVARSATGVAVEELGEWTNQRIFEWVLVRPGGGWVRSGLPAHAPAEEVIEMILAHTASSS
jgi:hypothetical protein